MSHSEDTASTTKAVHQAAQRVQYLVCSPAGRTACDMVPNNEDMALTKKTCTSLLPHMQ